MTKTNLNKKSNKKVSDQNKNPKKSKKISRKISKKTKEKSSKVHLKPLQNSSEKKRESQVKNTNFYKENNIQNSSKVPHSTSPCDFMPESSSVTNKERDVRYDNASFSYSKFIKSLFDLKAGCSDIMDYNTNFRDNCLYELDDKELEEALNILTLIEETKNKRYEPSLSQITYLNFVSKLKNKLLKLSLEYNLIIPHNFEGPQYNNFFIGTSERIIKEVELVYAIRDLKKLWELKSSIHNSIKSHKLSQNIDISSENDILSSNKNIKINSLLLDQLNCTFTCVPPSENLFVYIKEYVQNTRKAIEKYCFKLLSLFKIDEKGKEGGTVEGGEGSEGVKPLKNSPPEKPTHIRHYLYWYPCSLPSLVSVLKNGFILPSKNSPSCAFPFGKCLSFYDSTALAFSKSNPRNGVSYLLLCDVDIGEQEVVYHLEGGVNWEERLIKSSKDTLKIYGRFQTKKRTTEELNELKEIEVKEVINGKFTIVKKLVYKYKNSFVADPYDKNLTIPCGKLVEKNFKGSKEKCENRGGCSGVNNEVLVNENEEGGKNEKISPTTRE